MGEAAVKWSRLAALSGWQWRVLLTAPLMLPATWLRLRRSGYRATLKRCHPGGPGRTDREGDLEIARDTAAALAIAIRYGPWRPRCLLRSLTLARYLARRGIACDLRIGLPAGQPGSGVAADPDFSAHAWIEFEGVVLNDRDDVATLYVPFDAPAGRP